MLKVTVNDLFRLYAGSYRKKYFVSGNDDKIIRAISSCRTEALGGKVEVCSCCGHTVTLYNSCRDRHCPQCQFLKKEKWVLDKKSEVLPYQYFHAVFTVPDELNLLFYLNKEKLYRFLFETVKKVLFKVTDDKKYFGAKTGYFAILHTWGQKLNLHPHIHCVIPGGGYSDKNKKWVNADKNYLVPVEVLKRKFKYAFLTGLRKMFVKNELYTGNSNLRFKSVFNRLLNSLFKKEWVVYLKETFNNPDSVIEYLSRYTHRIAISNKRITGIKDGKVFFSYRDYKDGEKKIHSLKIVNFIRLFMLHSVPHRFMRIRYYGLLSNRLKSKTVKECNEFYKVKQKVKKVLSWQEVYFMITGLEVTKCRNCSKGEMVIKEIIKPGNRRAPPE